MFFKYLTNLIKSSKRVYLDYASSTMLDKKMLGRVSPVSKAVIGANPSALHTEGVAARRAIDSARAHIATVLHAHSDEIIFTSGATESDNLALQGTIASCIAQGALPQEIAVITTSLEHAAVSEAIAVYRDVGVFTVTIPADNGVIDPKHIIVPEQATVVIVSVMYVNNEIGTVQPIKDIAKRIRKLRKEHPDTQIIFHTDATQAPLHYSLRTDQLGVDLMTLGGTKLYTHRGVGVLYKKRSIKLLPLMRGGGQEQGLRPGTESLELIHTFAHALVYAQEIKEKETIRVRALQKYFEQQLKVQVPQALVTAQGLDRAMHITHIAIKGFDSELLVIELDARGIAVSAKSACKNEEDQESPIVESMYGKGWGAVRFSFGRMTKKKDLDTAVRALKKVLKKYAHQL